MTEQRKNKQRLGFLGPSQVNHHIPTHWGPPDSMVAPTWPLYCRAHTSPRIQPVEHRLYQDKVGVKQLSLTMRRRLFCQRKLHLVSTLSDKQHRIISVICAHPHADRRSSVNDWPNATHICQCGVSVPDGDKGKCCFPLMCQGADWNAAESSPSEAGKQVGGFFSPPWTVTLGGTLRSLANMYHFYICNNWHSVVHKGISIVFT